MPRKDRSNRGPQGSPTQAGNGGVGSEAAGAVSRIPGWIRVLDTAAFAAILLVVAMRPLLSETYDSALHSFDKVLPLAGSLGPATTAALDHVLWWAMLVLMGTATALRFRTGRTGLELGTALMAVGAVISCLAAGNKRLALNGSFSWLTAIALILVLSQLRADRFRRSLLIAVLVASGLTSAAKCWMQVKYELPETWSQYMQQREQFWAEQNIAMDDSRVELYERRLRASEATGFIPHPNGQGAYLAMVAFAALAGAALACDRRCRWVLIALAGVPLLTISTTGARAALLAAIGGVLLLVALCRGWRAVGEHRWKVLKAFWLAVVLGSAVVVAIGWRTGRLPEPSLEYRWGYWQVTARMITDHLWTGVGALNFDRIYLQYKPIEYPEEVNDPHNFVLSLTAQWGIFGGVGLLAAMVMCSLAITRRWEAVVQDPAIQSEQQPNAPPLRRWLIAMAVGFLLLRAVLFADLWLGTAADRAFAYFDLVAFGLIWIAAFSLVLVLMNSGQCPPASQSGRWAFSPALMALAGVLVFLLVNTVDFAIFLPGILFPFAVLAALVLMPVASETRMPDSGRGTWDWVAILLVAYAILAHGFLVVRPVVAAAMDVHKARSSLQSTAERAYRQAVESDPFDPTPAEELAELHASRGTPEELSNALTALDIAIVRDPHKSAFWRMRAGILAMLHEMTKEVVYLHLAVADMNKAVSRYPESPELHLELARLWANADAAGVGDARPRAIEQYQRALALDAARPGGENEVRSWSASRREQVQQELHRMQQR